MTRRLARSVLAVMACGLVLSGCGPQQPKPLEPLDPVVPSDLCASLPDQYRQSLETSATSDESGDPTASCALRSEPGAKDDVRGLVTVIVLTDEDSADTTYQSQCRALDSIEVQKTQVDLQGAEESCAGRGNAKGADSATLTALTGRHVVMVRYSSVPAGKPDALAKATELAQAVLPQSATS